LQEFKEELLRIASLMCYSALLLLHDEQSEIREPVCEFVASLEDVRTVSKFQHNYATKVEYDSLVILKMPIGTTTQHVCM